MTQKSQVRWRAGLGAPAKRAEPNLDLVHESAHEVSLTTDWSCGDPWGPCEPGYLFASPFPPIGINSNLSPMPARRGRARAISSCTAASSSEA